MRVTLSTLLFIASLPPFNLPLIGCFFLVPLLINRNDHDYKTVASDGFVFALAVSAYSYFGAWSYDIYAYLAIVLIYALLFTTFLYCAFLLISKNGLAAILVAPLLWVLVELIAESFNVPITLAVPLTTTPILLTPAQYGGQHMLSFLLLAFQINLIVLLNRQTEKHVTFLPAYLPGIFVSVFLLPSFLAQDESAETDSINISVVQTNAHPRHTVAIASDHMLEGLAQQRHTLLQQVFSSSFTPELIIWPEVSMAKYEFRKINNISRQAARYGVHMLVASPDMTPSGNTYNSIFSVSATGTILDRYNKNVLIPFIEEQAHDKQRWINHDQLPGHPGSIICYESVFPGPTAILSAAGAGFIALATNDAYAGPSILPELHLQFSRIRAVETGKTVIRAANAGPSAIIDANGEITHQLAMYTNGIINARIQPNYTNTFFVKHYQRIQITFWVLTILAVALFIIICTPAYQFHLPRQSIAGRHMILTMALLCSSLLFQHFYMRHIYQSNSGNEVPSGFINFQRGHIADTLPYTELKVDNAVDSLFSALAYVLRDFGNNVDLSRIRDIFRHTDNEREQKMDSVDIKTVMDRFGYTSTRNEYTRIHTSELGNIRTPSLALLTTGETVVINEFTHNAVIFFSPYYGEILAIKTAAFMKKWTGKSIALSTRERPWDI